MFLLAPRTASRATRLALLEQVPETIEVPGGYHADLYAAKFPIDIKDFQVLQTIRHPCDVLSTEYHRRAPHKQFSTLLSWLRSINYDTLEGLYPCNKNLRLRSPGNGLFFDDTTYNFRYEHLQTQLNSWWPNLKLKRDPAHSTNKPNWHDEWGYSEREWAKRYLIDLERYCYTV